MNNEYYFLYEIGLVVEKVEHTEGDIYVKMPKNSIHS